LFIHLASSSRLVHGTSLFLKPGNWKQANSSKAILRVKGKEEIYASFNEALMAVQERPAPDWDR